ncbi:chitosanase [Dactylosporangium sp. CA-139066]|uniref:chitosanase n=1 Tax=Dactylosporangium sp. CA-139066 TaxID=3239930 RepID=UPI003D8CF89C
MRCGGTAIVALLLAVLPAACSRAAGEPWPEAGHGPSAVALSEPQRRVADELIGVFEHGDPAPHYEAVETLGDGRGYTCGTIGFTTSGTEVRDVVAAYTADVPGSPLARYLPRLRELADGGSADTGGLDGFAADWKAAAADPRFRAQQDALAGRLTLDPALQAARKLGIRTPLGVAVLYDTAVQHGTGDDPDGMPALIARAMRRAGGEPAGGVDEQDWLQAFLDEREQTLRHAHDQDTRAAWSESTGRVDALRELVDDSRWRLDPPVRITVDGDDYDLR